MSLLRFISYFLVMAPQVMLAQQFPAGTAEHQRIILEDWRERSKEVEYCRSLLFKSLPADESQIVNSIRFSVIGGDRRGDQVIFPTAGFEDGERIVTIGQGFITQLQLFINEEVYAGLYNKQPQVELHLKQVIDEIKENQVRLQKGMPLKKVKSGEEYFRWDQATINKINTAGRTLLGFNIAFILAHEAGHHVLGHTSVNRVLLTNKEKMVQEEAADDWASKTMLSSGSLPAGAALSLAMFEAMFKVGIDTDHPSNGCRVKALLTSSISNVDRFSAQLKAAGNDVRIARRELEGLLKQIDEDEECVTDSDSSAFVPSHQEALLRVILAASQRKLSLLKGARNPDTVDSWTAAAIPGLQLDCTIDYESIDRSYNYACTKSVSSEELANDLLKRMKASISSLDGIVDLGDKASSRANRRIYTMSGVRISASVLSPRPGSLRQKWIVALDISEPSN